MYVAHDGTRYSERYTMTTVGWTISIVIAILLMTWICYLIRRGRRRGELRRLGYWRRWAATLIVILSLVYFYWGAFPNPQFTLSNLGGLTPHQVISRVGTPDMRFETTPPDKNYSALTFDYDDPYRWCGFSYGVIFGRDNRVQWVLVGSH